MMQFFRKNTRSIMLVVVVLFVVSCFAMYNPRGERSSASAARDHAVAKVDGKKVMASKIEQDIARIFENQGMSQNITSEDLPAIRSNILEQMAIMAEIEKEIKTRNIKVSPDLLDETIEGIQASFATREIFLQRLQQEGLDEKKLKENITEQLKQRLLFEEIAAGVSVDQGEVRSLYDTMAAVNSPNLAKVAGFTMNFAHFSNLEAAEKAFNKITAGKKWDDSMKEAASGDVLTFIPYDEPVFIPSDQFTDQFAFLEKQQMNIISKPVEIESGDYMLTIKRTEQKAGTATFDEISGDIEMMLQRQKGEALQTKFIQDLKNRAAIEILDEKFFKIPEPLVEEAVSEDVTEPAPQAAEIAPESNGKKASGDVTETKETASAASEEPVSGDK